MPTIVEHIEQTFALYVGPVSRDLVTETYALWTTKHKPRLANPVFYAQKLADNPPTEAEAIPTTSSDTKNEICQLGLVIRRLNTSTRIALRRMQQHGAKKKSNNRNHRLQDN